MHHSAGIATEDEDSQREPVEADGGRPRRGPEARRVGRRRWITALLVFVVVTGLDLSRAPESQMSARVLIAAIDVYQATLSKLMPVAGVQCRFQPTCSHYAEGSIRKYGALKGTQRAAWRLLRCGPWTEQGTIDTP